jgi:hypothetical protein
MFARAASEWYRSSVTSVSDTNFGPLVAYLVPGATVLAGLSPFFPILREWFAANPTDAPTLGGFLYLTVASLAAGMTVSAVRWVVVDTLHAWTGIRRPLLDFSRLDKNADAFSLLIDIHYEHYLFYSNALIAVAVAYGCYRVRLGGFLPVGWLDLGFVALEIVFFATSRDTLRKYYARTAQLLRAAETSETVPPAL